jgi:hypothetical protein
MLTKIQYIEDEPSLEMQMDKIGAEIKAFNQTQNNVLNVPVGFHRVRNAAGKELGLGHFCLNCKLHTKVGAQNGVKHCGRVDTVPTNFFKRAISFAKLKTYELPRVW